MVATHPAVVHVRACNEPTRANECASTSPAACLPVAVTGLLLVSWG